MGFDEVIIMFDGDDVGVAANRGETLPVGAQDNFLASKRCKQCLVNGQGHEIINAIFRLKITDQILSPTIQEYHC